jgi:hypothetical protein
LFLYRVLPFEPGIDRATVQIACHGDPANPGGPVEWRIEQLQGVCNKDVSVATVRLVEAWLAACACVQVYETNESEPTDDLFDDAAHDAELVPA